MSNDTKFTANQALVAAEMVIDTLNQMNSPDAFIAIEQIVDHMRKTNMLQVAIARSALVGAAYASCTTMGAQRPGIVTVATDIIQSLCTDMIDTMVDELDNMEIHTRIEKISFK